MKFKYHNIVITVLLLLTINNLFAIKATPYPITEIQPDGSQITYYLKGDEFFRYRTTLDGYLIVKNDKGIFSYGISDNNGKFESTDVKVNEINKRTFKEKNFIKTLIQDIDLSVIYTEKRMAKVASISSIDSPQKAYPSSGTPKSLVILVNFSDKSYITPDPKVAFTNLLNQQGYNANGGTGSARDYFRDASNGIFQPQFDVVGPFTLTKTMAFYGENVSDEDKNPRQMVIDACTLADANGVDFTQYDTDNDGKVDNVFIYYAGNNEAEGAPANTIWPHRWSLANTGTKFDGKIIYDYACTSELRGATSTNMCGIGTFCHEFGHVLGLADYYATNKATHQTLSYWNIMDAGAYLNSGRTPPTYSAFDRFYLNWLRPVELKSPQSVTLEALTLINKAFIITQNGNHNLNGASPSPTEFFMLENRQKSGWDTYLPGNGLLISRINYNASAWYSNTVNNTESTMGYDIIEANGLASNNNLAGDPFPGTTNKTSYMPTLRSGTVVNKPLTFIKDEYGTITFRFMGGGLVPIISTDNIINSFSTVQGTPSTPQKLIVGGKKLVSGLIISFNANNHFEIKKSSDPETAWSKWLTLAPNSDSIVVNTEILVRYNPMVPSFSETHTDNIVLESSAAEKVAISVAGVSTRPVYVVPPVATEASEITLGSFVANWNQVYDASGYYLTVYNVSNEVSEKVQGFDNGLVAPAGWTIAASAVTTSAEYSGKAVPAIQMKNTGDYIQTEEYVSSPTSVSVVLKSLAGSGGYLFAEAWNGLTWSKIDSIPVTINLSGVKTITYSAEKKYTKFKFTYFKGAGFVALDDITATFSQKIEMNVENKWVTTNNVTLINLMAEKDYYYKVRASDKTYEWNNSIKYENITRFSNLIPVRTLKDVDANRLQATIEPDGSVKVIVPLTDEFINVYNVIGQKIRVIKPVSNIVRIYNLPRNQMYILQSGKRKTKIAL
ncbi:MAG: M6 family metalloprotease domain-containing protein [Paludibacter sp.]|nr:M6 family metalloprotease domain-containing protein [Paludibacter sp.]